MDNGRVIIWTWNDKNKKNKLLLFEARPKSADMRYALLQYIIYLKILKSISRGMNMEQELKLKLPIW